MKTSLIERTILHVDMDAFFVSVEETLDPSLKGKPVIVGGDPAARRGVVAAASYTARKYGIHSAMPISKARRLCPHAIFLRGSFRQYERVSRRIFDIFERYSPCVQSMSLDEGFIDLTGCELLHGPVFRTAQRIHDEIRDSLGINASIGIASNKLVAKVASDFAKPNGMLYVLPGYERHFLAPLPIGRIPGIGPQSGKQLRRMNVYRVGDFFKFDLQHLERLFGQWGEALYWKVRGRCDSPVRSSEEPAKSISRETTFQEDTRDARFLETTLSYLTEKVVSQLRETGLKARCVTLKIRTADFSTATRSRTLQKATSDDHIILQTGRSLFRHFFYSAWNREPPGIRLIGIGVSAFEPPGAVQGELFHAVSRERWDPLYQGIDRIRGKYGFRSILRASSWKP